MNILRFIVRFWLIIAIILSILLAISIYLLVSRSVVDSKDVDLSNKSLSYRRAVATTLHTDIKNLPTMLDDKSQAAIKNRLAILLRQTYGKPTSDQIVSVRQSIGGYNSVNYYELYIDVIPQNVTYFAIVDTQTRDISISCAPKYLQIDQDSSHCTDTTKLSIFDFPKG